MGFQPRSINLTALTADPSVRIVTKVGLRADPSGSKLRVLTFADLGAGATRHILCSKKVSDAALGKLDAALSKLARSTKP